MKRQGKVTGAGEKRVMGKRGDGGEAESDGGRGGANGCMQSRTVGHARGWEGRGTGCVCV